jgi:uncharacterized membrane protein YkoI
LSFFAAQNTMTVSEHNSIHGYNNKPTVKMQKKRNMHRLHKIDEVEIAKITQEKTNEEADDIKLLHSVNILKYQVKTKTYILTINALDGTVINKRIKK